MEKRYYFTSFFLSYHFSSNIQAHSLFSVQPCYFSDDQQTHQCSSPYGSFSHHSRKLLTDHHTDVHWSCSESELITHTYGKTLGLDNIVMQWNLATQNVHQIQRCNNGRKPHFISRTDLKKKWFRYNVSKVYLREQKSWQ